MIFNFGFFYGLLIPLLPAFGSGALLVLSIIFAVFHLKYLSKDTLKAALPFLSVIAAWTLSYFVFSLGYSGFLSLWNWHGISGVFDWMIQPGAIFSLSFLSLLRYLIFFVLFGILVCKRELRDSIVNGIFAGLTLSLIFSILEVIGDVTFPFTNQNQFWLSLDRFAGTFTDPNAMGIFLALALPVLWSHIAQFSARYKLVGDTLLVAVLILGLYSGSRSFVLALGIYFALFVYSLPKRTSLSILCGILVTILTTILAIYIGNLIAPSAFTSLFNLFSINLLPSSVSRIANTFLGESVNDSFFSRSVFSRIGISLFSDSPYIGSGFENFRFLVNQQAELLNIALSGWVDNSNNFYTGLLAELGIFGFLALIFFFTQLKYNFSNKFSSASFLTLIILLIFGPHLSFDEVAVLSALILSDIAKPKQITARVFATAVVLLILPLTILIPVKAASLNLGLFSQEGFNEGVTYNWSSVVSQKHLTCVDGMLSFKIRAIHPNISESGVKLIVKFIVSGAVQGSKEFLLQNADLLPISLPCHDEGQSQIVNFRVEPPWMPSLVIDSRDNRVLGVQIY